MLDNCPVTVEEFVEGEFQKYVNNTGEYMVPSNDELSTLYEKGKPWFTTAILCLPENSCLLINREQHIIYMIQKLQF